MDQQKLIGLAVGGGVGFVVGTFASIYVNNVLYNNGAPYHLEKVAFVVPACVGAGVGYLASK